MKRRILSRRGQFVAAYLLLILTWIVIVPPTSYAQQINCPPDPPALACDVDPVVAITGEPVLLDLCPNPVVTFSDSIIPGNCPNTYTILRTWAVTDDCMNNLSCTQTITVLDDVQPMIFCPANITLECDMPFNPSAVGVATAADNCSVDIDLVYSDNLVTTTTLERTWTATDACGNTASCVQVITFTVTDCPLKVVPVRFCIFGKGDNTNNSKRFERQKLLDGLRKKNELWKQCNVQFKTNKDAVNEIEDKKLPPSGNPGDVLWNEGFEEFNAVMNQCNEAAGKDALEKLTDIFIRSFVDKDGKKAAINGGAYETESCTKKTITSKPLVTDPSYGTTERFGTTMAHENGHALSLPDLKEDKDKTNVMYYIEMPGKNKFEDAQCKQARVEAQKISGTTDKDAQGKPVDKSAPRTRVVTDDLNPDSSLVWSDIMEHAVTYLSDKSMSGNF